MRKVERDVAEARAAKARALLAVLDEHARMAGMPVLTGEKDVGMLDRFRAREWAALARKAKVRPPGPDVVALATFRGTDPNQPGSASVEAPMPTISAGGIHVGEVRAFLSLYYGNDGPKGQKLDEPARTIRAKHCLGLVTVHGVDYQIVDVGFRMVEPHELKRAQYGRFAAGYDMRDAKTKAAKVKLLGNSVPPEMVEALVSANVPRKERIAA